MFFMVTGEMLHRLVLVRQYEEISEEGRCGTHANAMSGQSQRTP